MTKTEFAGVIAWLSAAIGKPIVEGQGEASERERKVRIGIFYELLGDLPVEVLRVAAKRVALSHPWATFPSVAELRLAAADIAIEQSKTPSEGEAWQMAWRAICRIDPDISGSVDRQTKDLPDIVVTAMRQYGIVALIQAKPEFARREFMRIYKDLTNARRQLVALAPAKAGTIGVMPSRPAAVAAALSIGQMPKEEE